MKDLNKSLKAAIDMFEKQIEKNPGFDVYKVIGEQLTEIKYNIDNNIIPNEEDKKSIYIGLIAVREFGEADPVFSKRIKGNTILL